MRGMGCLGSIVRILGFEKRRATRAMETAAAVEIDQGGLRQLLLHDFHHCLEKPPQKTLRLSHSSHSADDGCQISKTKNRVIKHNISCTPMTLHDAFSYLIRMTRAYTYTGITGKRVIKCHTVIGPSAFLGQSSLNCHARPSQFVRQEVADCEVFDL